PLRCARSMRPPTLRAVHFVIDTAEADVLREEWTRANRGIVLDFIDCPDRRLARAAAELVSAEAEVPGTHVTAVLPRRSYSPLLGRLLHDRTADKIAAVVSRIPHCAATIVPFDVRNRLEVLRARQSVMAATGPDGQAAGVKTAGAATGGTPAGGRQDVKPGEARSGEDRAAGRFAGCRGHGSGRGGAQGRPARRPGPAPHGHARAAAGPPVQAAAR